VCAKNLLYFLKLVVKNENLTLLGNQKKKVCHLFIYIRFHNKMPRAHRSEESSSDDDGEIKTEHLQQQDKKENQLVTTTTTQQPEPAKPAPEPAFVDLRQPIIRPREKKKTAKGALRNLFLGIYFWIHMKWLLMTVWVSNFLNDVTPEDSKKQREWAAMKEEEKKKNLNQTGNNLKRMARHISLDRKFVHIGDDFALGVGDWALVMEDCGLNQYLRLKQPFLLSNWKKLNCGKFQSTSEDWLPGNPLFEKYFHPDSGIHINAEIVMITLGSCDVCSATQSSENLKAIVTTLRQRMPEVHIVINIPPVPVIIRDREDDSIVKKRCLQRTDAMRDAIKKLVMDDVYGVGTTEKAPPMLDHLPTAGYIRFGADMDAMFNCQPTVFCLGDLFLKPRGYREVVRLGLGDAVLLAQKSVEKVEMEKFLLTRTK
jgi:hypothetical protein